MLNRKFLKVLSVSVASALVLSMAACSSNTTSNTEDTSSTASANVINASDITINEEITNNNDSEHAIEADGETTDYSNISVIKTGNSDSGDEADFYGDNAAIFATNGATLTLTNIVADTNGTHANAVFSYGEGTTINISDSVITTSGNCSGGLMTTGGGTMNATNLNIHTSGNSSAAIRSDRGGGTVTVTGGSYVTDGTGSPVIYSTADITVNDASMAVLSDMDCILLNTSERSREVIDEVVNRTVEEKNGSYHGCVTVVNTISDIDHSSLA